MCPNEIIVRIPRKLGVSGPALAETHIGPVLGRALRQINADAHTRDAACAALASSEGCVVLANYLNSEVKRSRRADYRFKVPLLVLAAHHADQDGGVDLVYDPAEGALYAETDDAQYSFHIFKDWTVDWEAVAHETIPHYAWSGIEQQTWALDALLRHAA